jgi:hypothetical protein
MLPINVKIYFSVRKVLCRSILGQVLLCVVSSVTKQIAAKNVIRNSLKWTDLLRKDVRVQNVKTVLTKSQYEREQAKYDLQGLLSVHGQLFECVLFLV